ncbi:MAG: pyruvate, phosphate dikinase [Gemmatimonadota bacterium]|nr:pyruvate, phosphate dikinase [Gemmatimonadota bacterium]
MGKFIYLFTEVEAAESAAGSWDAVRSLLGGKGANLADMTRLGIPVPPGFTATTEACNAYLESGGRFPDGFWAEELAAVDALEAQTGKIFGDPENPLLLSCRSGAKFSMPGMMDTVLNLGLNDEITAALADRTADARFAYDLYRRLLQMFGSVVLNLDDEAFERVISRRKDDRGVTLDAELTGEDWKDVCGGFKAVIRTFAGQDFPQEPRDQLHAATEAVFRSWNGKRAIDYRQAAGIPNDLGTAVNVQTMVFGNIDGESATGVCMSRNGTTGAKELEGDYLENAQGEDVVAGTRQTHDLSHLERRMPRIFGELREIADKLERRHRNMQDLEFTIESGRLWILQTRDGKRTAEAEVRIAVDMADEGLIEKSEALERVSAAQVDVFLHPTLDPEAVGGAEILARGLPVSPGAAVGQIVFEADTAERVAGEGRPVILVRPDTKPDDVHGMLAARGIVTSRGGRTSHAALVARQFGRPALVGVVEMEIDVVGKSLTVGDVELTEGDWVSIDGTRGLLFAGQLPTVTADLENPSLARLLSWADEVRVLRVRANADYPEDAERARRYGAEGIGLCRTEHMFFESDRLPVVQRMIMAADPTDRAEALAELLPLQRGDFEGLFEAMDGLPVIIRLIDPPLHEFLPDHDELVRDLADLKVQLQHFHTLSEIDGALADITTKQRYLDRVESLREENPMLGTRGVRLGMLIPGLVQMQVRAIFEAACACAERGIDVHPEVMVPLVAHVAELRAMREMLEAEARSVMSEAGIEVPYRFGSMIEIPRAAVTAAQIAETAEFFSFGTNDLTQTTFGISRDDAEQGFLVEYLKSGVLSSNPFETIDEDGVGRLMEWAVREGKRVRPELEMGICGEHGGDPASIDLCHRLGLDYVSCSPFRVPIARLSAAHAALRSARAEARSEDELIPETAA